MQMNDLIVKKRDGGILSKEEIDFMISRYTAGAVPDYQMSAMLMAIVWRGMNRRETLDLTMAMMRSGDTLDLSGISGVKADKHSTGGVGDKTSLALLPMVAAQGIHMAKMSGRGLGHTGGTIDKLESIPGFSTSLDLDRFLSCVEKVGFAIAGQTADLDPADKKLYALRDVTGTVPSVPLIVSSIMSKKLAAGADIIVLDVKCGSGSFMKTEKEARELAEAMVDIGRAAGRKTVACITDMDEPLGCAVGNALEVMEAVSLLKGSFGGSLLELCLTLGSLILTAAGAAAGEDEARAKLEKGISDGSAAEKFREFVRAQGGNADAVDDFSLLPQAKIIKEVPSPADGYVTAIHAEDVGRVSMHLGGGRATKESAIDLSVGLVLRKKTGDRVRRGESLAAVHASDPVKAEEAAALLTECFEISGEKPEKRPFIKAVIR